jgi:hypothetical protein
VRINEKKYILLVHLLVLSLTTLNLCCSPRLSGYPTIGANISVANEWKLKPLGQFDIVINSQSRALILPECFAEMLIPIGSNPCLSIPFCDRSGKHESCACMRPRTGGTALGIAVCLLPLYWNIVQVPGCQHIPGIRV